MIAYLEWGSRVAVINSKKTENPIDVMNQCLNGVGVKQLVLI
jgi:hypothetical protein